MAEGPGLGQSLAQSPAKPELKDLVNDLKSVTDWYSLGVNLGLKLHQLHEIRNNHPHNNNWCKIDMLGCWLGTTTNPTWEAVADALDLMEKHRVADKIRRKYAGTQRELATKKGGRSTAKEDIRGQTLIQDLELQQHLQQQEKRIKELQEENQHLRQELDKLLEQLMKRKRSSKPCRPSQMCYRGSATVHGHMAYFRPDGTRNVLSYNSEEKVWDTLPKCPTVCFTLTVIKGFVTLVGGQLYDDCTKITNKLFSLKKHEDKMKWVECFRPMLTKRYFTAVVCSGKTLVVAGGVGEFYRILDTVEVMDSNTQQWLEASSLLDPLYDASATISGDKIYLVGGYRHDRTKSVFTWSLSARKKWEKITDLEVKCSTCVTLNGQLLAVGGKKSDGKDSNNIYSYNTETNSWDTISQMDTPRNQCLVTVLPGNKLMVAGGQSGSQYTNEVEIIESL